MGLCCCICIVQNFSSTVAVVVTFEEEMSFVVCHLFRTVGLIPGKMFASLERLTYLGPAPNGMKGKWIHFTHSVWMKPLRFKVLVQQTWIYSGI